MSISTVEISDKSVGLIEQHSTEGGRGLGTISPSDGMNNVL